MTIRQMLVAGSMTVGSKIAFKGSATAATTSVTLPTHASGDTIIIVANGTTQPTIPAGWTEIGTDFFGFGGSQKVSVAYKVATGASEVSGTWTNAARMIAVVYDGVSSVGTATFWSGGSTTYWKGITISDPDSWAVGIGGFTAGNGYDSPPSGMTHRTSVGAGASGTIAYNDTASAIAAWNQKTTSGTYSYSATYVFELVSE